MSEPKMLPVPSSTVELAGYDPDSQELHLKFKSGPMTYVYSGFPPGKFHEFMGSKSKGLFHANQIKDKYKFSKVKPVPPQL